MYLDLEEKFNTLPKKTERFKCPIVIRILDDVEKPDLQGLFAAVKKHFPKENVFIEQDSICIVISSDKVLTAGFVFPEIDKFNSVLEKYGAYALEGNSSQLSRSISVLFNECYQTLPIAVAVRYGAEEKKRVLKYHRYIFYYTIWLAEKSMKKEVGIQDVLYLVDPAVLLLTRYDRSFGSDLRDFLYTYLLYDCNISETSRQMYAHRNTVIYKLTQIKELIGTDWVKNPHAKHNLLSSCMILRYVENYRKQYINLPPIEKALLKRTQK